MSFVRRFIFKPAPLWLYWVVLLLGYWVVGVGLNRANIETCEAETIRESIINLLNLVFFLFYLSNLLLVFGRYYFKEKSRANVAKLLFWGFGLFQVWLMVWLSGLGELSFCDIPVLPQVPNQ